jgi:hypothetical protein
MCTCFFTEVWYIIIVTWKEEKNHEFKIHL